MNQMLAQAIVERQRELNELREAIGLPVDTSHDDMLAELRRLSQIDDAHSLCQQ